MSAHYDAVIIGAGMSGLAAGIRFALFGKRVLILEKHSIAGGLNSYYQRKNETTGDLRLFDVGLHALTNTIQKGEKGKPFSKLLKQLRLSWDDFQLKPQTHSKIVFPDVELKFSNDFKLLESEVREKFPDEIEKFQKLITYISSYDELSLISSYTSSRDRLKEFISNPLLREMLLCPLLIYGSSWEEDMDFGQFVIMFKAIYFDGFSRPKGGVRTIINLLLEKFNELGGEIRFRTPVTKILTKAEKVVGVELANQEVLLTDALYSSAGLPETYALVSCMEKHNQAPVGVMTFVESILVFDKKLNQSSDSTILFYNNAPTYKYSPSQKIVDLNSAVVCCPDNYEREITQGEGTIRVTYISHYDQWKQLSKDHYKKAKEEVAMEALKLAQNLFPEFKATLLFKDVFTPLTLEKYTWHLKGIVYGSTQKVKDGRTKIQGLFIIGTDQGFLGIVGSLLSGISMANLHGLETSLKSS